MTYPTWQELADAGHTPDYLDIGAAAMAAMRAVPGFLEKRTTVRDLSPDARREYDRTQRADWVKRNHNKPKGSAPRLFKSRFVGVTVHRDRWLAQWGPKGALKGRVFPLTPEGEVAAAWERARALGLAEPEVRPADQVAPPREPSAPLEPRGHAKKRVA